MEDNIDVTCDSDVSDGWSIVDSKSEDVATHFRSSTDSGLCSETLVTSQQQATTDDLDECYELTEIIDPLGVNKPEGSDIDSDGISVIGEDELAPNWIQTAHENYEGTLKLLETPPRERQLVELDVPAVPWQQNFVNFLRKNVVASAVIVAIAGIALAQYFKTESAGDKMEEMLDSLEKLRAENQKLQTQFETLTLAYTTLKAKISPEVKSTPEIQEILDNYEIEPKLRAALEKLGNTPQNAKIINSLTKLIKRKNTDDVMKKLTEFLEKFEKRGRKRGNDGLKIVQWYSEEAEKPVEYSVPDLPKKKKVRVKKGGRKVECENRNKTGMWYLDRAKSRESSRETKEWSKGRRDIKREDNEKGMWYLRRLELHARSRQ